MHLRKILSFVLALVMIAVSAIPAFAADSIKARAISPAQTTGFTEPKLLTRQSIAPDLLTMLDGTPVDSPEQWAERRKEIRALLEYYFYGPVPIYNGDYYSHTISGTNNNVITVGLRGGGSPDTTRNLSAVTITCPPGEAPEGGWPLFLDAPNSAFWQGQGYATAAIPTANTAFRQLYPNSTTDWSKNTGAYGVAAYNVEMLIHALKAEAEGENRLKINPAKVAVSGASTNGKRAAAIGAMADSVWLSIPGSGGTGGVNLYRQNSANTVWNMFSGPSTLNGAPGSMGASGNSTTGMWGPIGLAEAWGGHAGWAGNFGLNYGLIPELNADFAPVDAHFVAAMMAREGTFYFPATGLSNEGTNGVPGLQQTINLALPVYELLGLGDHLGARVTTTAHGVDIEASVLIMATIDHVEGRHGECDGNCDLSRYYSKSGAPAANIQSYLNSLNFNISDMHVTPFLSEENAAAWARIQPTCNGGCDVCECPEWCPHTADGQCCDPGVPPTNPALKTAPILIDFTGEDVDSNPNIGRPRQGLGWNGPSRSGIVNANGMLQQAFTDHGGGILFNLPLGDSYLGNYAELEFTLLVSASGGAESASPIGVTFTQDREYFPGSGNWWDAKDLAAIRIDLPYAGVGVLQTYKIDLTKPYKDADGKVVGLTNKARWATGNVSLAIGRNAHDQTLQFGYIKLIPINSKTDPVHIGFHASVDKKVVDNGDYFNLSLGFNEDAKSNTVSTVLSYDSDVFEYRGFTSAEGLIPLKIANDSKAGILKLILGSTKGYSVESLGNVLFSVKNDVKLDDKDLVIKVDLVEYVIVNNEGVKEIRSTSAAASVTTGSPLNSEYFLIGLSDVIDFFGVTNADDNWSSARQYDYNRNGKIDIDDICFYAMKIR